MSEKTEDTESVPNSGIAEDIVFDAVSRRYSGNLPITETMAREDLELDSLELFEVCAEIEERTNISIAEKLQDVETIGDLINIASETGENSSAVQAKKYDIRDFPKRRTAKDFRFLKQFKFLTGILWDFQVVNGEVLAGKEKYILCPNHESFFDPLWVVAALQTAKVDISHFYCMAAEYLMDKKLIKRAFYALGGIPVDREGNSVPAAERAMTCLQQDKCIMLIHPEGTRSRSGKLNGFKSGAAKLAIKTDTEIIPVCIKGAYEIYPPTKKFPRIMRKNGKKYTIQIVFGQPVQLKGKSEAEITRQIRGQIEEIKGIEL